MARIRTVKPDFFKHYDLYKAEKDTGLPLRLAYSGLWTCADKEGRFKWQPQQLKLDVLPYDDIDFAKVLQELEKRGFIQSYEVRGSRYAWIPTFKDHQRITGSEAVSVSKIPEPPRNDQGNILETPKKREGNYEDDRKGREGRGREEERKGEEDASKELLGIVIYDAEQEILSNQIQFEQICIKTGKDPTTAKEVLRKYHLWLIDKEQYPKGKKAVYAGFEKWLMNEKNHLNGSTNQSVTNVGAKLGTSEARTKKAREWGSDFISGGT